MQRLPEDADYPLPHLPRGGQPTGPKAACRTSSCLGPVMKLTAPPTTGAHPRRPPQLGVCAGFSQKEGDLGKPTRTTQPRPSARGRLRLQGPRQAPPSSGSPSPVASAASWTERGRRRRISARPGRLPAQRSSCASHIMTNLWSAST